MENKPVFYYSQHKELWNWLSRNPLRKKEEYFKNFGLPEPYMQCYACDVVKKIIPDEDHFLKDCDKYCPLKWPEEHCLNSYYSEWHVLRDDFYFTQDNTLIPKIIEMSKKIRDIPLIENVTNFYRLS